MKVILKLENQGQLSHAVRAVQEALRTGEKEFGLMHNDESVSWVMRTKTGTVVVRVQGGKKLEAA
jgi:ribosomal silencing factor RsfS